MEFSFGIITDGSNRDRVLSIMDTIRNEEIPKYEIIVVGGSRIKADDVVHVAHDENSGLGNWITYKKNRITGVAKYEQIVYMHDYISLAPGWYNGFLLFGDKWDVCMTKRIDMHGGRYDDWILEPISCHTNDCFLPYDVLDLSFHMYISGAYWVAKKLVMREFPLDENLRQADCEDIAWSRQVSKKYKFSINTNSVARNMKPKFASYGYANREIIEYFRKKQSRDQYFCGHNGMLLKSDYPKTKSIKML